MNLTRRLLLVAALVAAAARADAPIELTSDLRGLELQVTTGWIGNRAFVRLENTDIYPAQCRAHFKSGPESRERRGTVEPGKETLLTYVSNRQVVKMRIKLTCAISPHDRELNDPQRKDSKGED